MMEDDSLKLGKMPRLGLDFKWHRFNSNLSQRSYFVCWNRFNTDKICKKQLTKSFFPPDSISIHPSYLLFCASHVTVHSFSEVIFFYREGDVAATGLCLSFTPTHKHKEIVFGFADGICSTLWIYFTLCLGLRISTNKCENYKEIPSFYQRRKAPLENTEVSLNSQSDYMKIECVMSGTQVWEWGMEGSLIQRAFLK